MTSIIEINGVDFPAPSNIKIKNMSIDNINVNELGEEQRDNIRTDIYYASLGFEELNNSEFHLIMTALEPLILNVKFPASSGLKIRQMRIDGDLNADMVKGGDNRAYWNVSFNLKEY